VSIKRGQILEGIVKGITQFGAFVELPSGKVGLVHISEVADEYVEDIKKYLKENQTVKVKVINVKEDGKISLSIKRVNETTKRENEKKRSKDDFEAKLSKFLKDSNQKLSEYNKRYDGKRR
jgi:S1 RNA binding domain protein